MKPNANKKVRPLKTIQSPRLSGVFFTVFKKTALPFFATLLIMSCSDADQIGLGLIDSPAKLDTDTLAVQAYTLPGDSVPTSTSRQKVLGVIDDPVFGKTRSSIYTEIRMEGSTVSLGTDPQLDSIHLVLKYEGSHYGNLDTPLTLRIYELIENFEDQDTLYSNSSIPHSADLITRDSNGFLLQPAPKDSVMVDTILQMPQIRIPLSNSFGQKFIDANDTDAFENIPGFLEVFKGLFITVDENLSESSESDDHAEGKGSMFQIDMIHPLTSVELFYRQDEIPTVIRFPINEFAKHFSRVEHFGFENVLEPLKAQVVDLDLSWGDSLLFIQALGQVRTNIYFPFLDELDGKPWLINKAELVVPVEETFLSETFPAIPQLLLFRYDEDGDINIVYDYAMGLDYFGGKFEETNNRYVFNITQHFQQLIDGQYPNHGMAIVSSRSHDKPGRVVLHGPGRTEDPMKLVLYYSVFE